MEIHYLLSGPYLSDSIILSTRPVFKNPIVLREKFLTQGLSAVYLAKEWNCFPTTVRAYLRKFGIRRAVQAGKNRRNLALGEKLVKGRVVSHRAEQRVLKSILNMYQEECLTPTAIARVLNSMGVPTKRQGKKWAQATIVGILTRQGVYRPTRPKNKG